MKKIIAGIFLIMSVIGVSASYKVTVKTGVKISKENLQNNNTKIEKELKRFIKENSKKETFNEILNMKQGSYSYNDLEPLFFVGALNIVLRNAEIEIKEIEYISETEADIKLKFKSAEMHDLTKIYEKVENNFKKKTGRSLESINTNEDEKKYSLEILKDFLRTADEHISKLPKTSEKIIVINAEKEGNKWKIDTEEFSNEIVEK
ncbi:MAG: hypothetical protein Q4D53_03395 [Leptotrichiaceae bacterium]|nr:hypothetical protein [Leptotrichiaceae bacterium]